MIVLVIMVIAADTISITFYRFMFYYAKLTGLMPIQVLTEKNPHLAKSCWFSIGYSAFSTILLILLVVCQFFKFSDYVERSQSTQTIIVMIFIGCVVNSFKNLWLYMSQTLNHKQLVNLVNDAFKLKKVVTESFAINEVFLDKHCRQMTHRKILLSLVQVLILIYALLLTYNTRESNVMFSLDFLFTFLTDGLSILFTSVYFGSMLVVLQCYRYLNKKLKRSIKHIHNIALNGGGKMKMQMYCDVCDTIDRIANIYDQISVFTKNFNSFISIILALALLDAIIYTLCAVIIDFICSLYFYYCY